IRIMSHFCFFFFSSRRRHTRSKRDWSSDVCSSDLAKMARLTANLLSSGVVSPFKLHEEVETKARSIEILRKNCAASSPTAERFRSEERRVGKECKQQYATHD